MSTDELEHADSDEILNASVAGILSIASILITVTHGYKVYCDLFTAERASLQSQREKPEINTNYKRATYLTLVTVILYCTLITVFAIEYNFSYSCMPGFMFIEFIAFFGTKCGLYLTYILRLHLVYGASPYGYKVRNMICLSVTVIIFSSALLVIGEIVLFVEPRFRQDSDNVFPHYCSIAYPMEIPYAAALAYLTLLYDVVATIASIIGFTVPLNKIIKLAKTIKAADTDGKDVEDEYNFKRYGYKYKVIVISASVTTLLWIVLFIVGLSSIASVFYLLDVLINPICLLLMTPYYPSKLYYEKLCCLCIFCCDRQKASFAEDQRSMVKSASLGGTQARSDQTETIDVTAVSQDTKDAASVTTKNDADAP